MTIPKKSTRLLSYLNEKLNNHCKLANYPDTNSKWRLGIFFKLPLLGPKLVVKSVSFLALVALGPVTAYGVLYAKIEASWIRHHTMLLEKEVCCLTVNWNDLVLHVLICFQVLF